MLLRDAEHVYRSLAGVEGHCRVRIYAPTAASGGLPIVLLEEMVSNTGPSVTNEVEQIAAEVVSRYLPEQDGLEPPALFVEHYPDMGCRRDELAAEHFDQVTCAHSAGRPRFWNVQRGMLQRFGEPEWRRIQRTEVEAWIGEALPEPACTCPVAHG
jgi:hypothetical protein